MLQKKTKKSRPLLFQAIAFHCVIRRKSSSMSNSLPLEGMQEGHRRGAKARTHRKSGNDKMVEREKMGNTLQKNFQNQDGKNWCADQRLVGVAYRIFSSSLTHDTSPWTRGTNGG